MRLGAAALIVASGACAASPRTPTARVAVPPAMTVSVVAPNSAAVTCAHAPSDPIVELAVAAAIANDLASASSALLPGTTRPATIGFVFENDGATMMTAGSRASVTVRIRSGRGCAKVQLDDRWEGRSYTGAIRGNHLELRLTSRSSQDGHVIEILEP